MGHDDVIQYSATPVKPDCDTNYRRKNDALPTLGKRGTDISDGCEQTSNMRRNFCLEIHSVIHCFNDQENVQNNFLWLAYDS